MKVKIVSLEEHMPAHNRVTKPAEKRPAPEKPKRQRGKTQPTRLNRTALRKLKALAVKKDTDLSGAVEWLFDQLPEVKESIERFMADK